VRVLLVSTYELGHQPLSVATASAALVGGGHEVRCVDVAVDTLGAEDVDWAERVALSVPMHTAMRLALRVAGTVRARRPAVPVCFFGLYAGMARGLTRASPADAVIAGEYEPGLVAWAHGRDPGDAVALGRHEGGVPDRRVLPALSRYTRFSTGSEERLVGSVAASRGCSHRCRHCPVPVVYDGRVRPVPEAVVIADVDQLVAAGAGHISFADPDFLNAPHHSRRIISAIHRRHPELSFDATIKVSHILRQPDALADLAEAGCSFVVSAFETVSDPILRVLDKGHDAADASAAVTVLRGHGMEVRPSWMPFTPWTTIDDLVAIMDFVIAHDLVANVDPVQYSIRLLVPDGSLLLSEPSMTPHLRAYDATRLGWTWEHPDPAIDHLQSRVAALVESQVGEDPQRTFEDLDSLIRLSADGSPRRPTLGMVSAGPAGARAHLTEPWFCCSEPTEAQLAPLAPLA
jgi:radical SAM superfamily enzyme YgiQ (UPF0313 family)